jgi:membrane associated rhomboid family serine protease
MTPAPVGLRCPEHSGKPQGVRKVASTAERVATRGGRWTAPVTMALIAVNVGVYLLELALGGSWDGTSNWIYAHGALLANGAYGLHGVDLVSGPPGAVAPGAVMAGTTHGEWWRLVTAAFLHYGPLHLGLNMLALYWFGPLLERMIGSWRYLLLYFCCGVAGSAGALWLSPNDITVGASGAIFGVLGALLVLERRGHIASGGQILGLIVINLVFTFAMAGVSIGGHLGGLTAGIALMLLYIQFARSPGLCVASAVAIALGSIVVAYTVV